MKKIICYFLLFATTSAMADSCWRLYEKAASEINEKGYYSEVVGDGFFIWNHTIDYSSGVEIKTPRPNWVQDLMDAIKYGERDFISSHPERKKWLEMFRQSVKKSCPLPKDNYSKLQSMLKELMDDGSFCPSNKILNLSFPFKGKKNYKEIFRDAVSSGRFADSCQTDKSISEGRFKELDEDYEMIYGPGSVHQD